MKREAFFDNAKLFLIFLVVFGHVIQPVTGQYYISEVLYKWIYLFHMPAFIFVSGFFARGSASTGYLRKLAKKLLGPYLFFQLLYTGYYYLIGKPEWESSLYDPQWALWFLVSLFSWHLLLIGFKKMPPLFGIILSVELGIIIGYVDMIDHTFSLSRTFVFFPFFLIGYWCTKKNIAQLKQKFIRLASIFILLTSFIFLLFMPDLSISWLLGSHSYQSMGAAELGGLIRFAIYLISILMIVSVLAWIPEKQYSFTNLGQKTIYVYLLHGLFIQYFRVHDLIEVNTFLDGIGLVVITATIVWFLSSKLVVALTEPLIEWEISILQSFFLKQRRKRKSMKESNVH
ncbi:acyltransferase family protein [Aquibacillus kalidii]|uniref:acyltransferase family protein n=1 Tax=Aquibacillus kalidii TaxID=2762597 RepID=UPI001644155B|nr:acyltransferase family protein [Aquibacillus kalidii]